MRPIRTPPERGRFLDRPKLPWPRWLGTLGQGNRRCRCSHIIRPRRIRHQPHAAGQSCGPTASRHAQGSLCLIWVCSDRSIKPARSGSPRHDHRVWRVQPGGQHLRSDVESRSSDAGRPHLAGPGKQGIDVIDPGRVRVAALRPDPQRPEDGTFPRTTSNAFAAFPTTVTSTWETELGCIVSDRAARGAVRVSNPSGNPTAQCGHLLLYANAAVSAGFRRLWALPLNGRVALPYRAGERASPISASRHLPGARANSLWVGTKNESEPCRSEKRMPSKRIFPSPPIPARCGRYITSLLTDRTRAPVDRHLQVGGVNILESRDAHGKPQLRRSGPPGTQQRQCQQAAGGFETQHWVSTDDGWH